MTKHRRHAAEAGLIAALLGMTGACSSSATISSLGNGSSASGTSAAGTRTTTPAPTTTTTHPAMSNADYQGRLKAVNAALAPDLDKVRSSKTSADISAALKKLGTDARAQADAVPTDAPTAAVTANTSLATALGDLADAADTDADKVTSSAVCTGAAATALLTRSPGAVSLRDAAAKLAAVDPTFANTVAAFLPAPIADQERRLDNGAVVRRAGGPGKLTVHAADQDTLVSLVAPGSTSATLSFYVRASQTATLSGVPGKTFKTFVTSGVDWDAASKSFSRDCSFTVTDKEDDYSQYDITLTLYKVSGGNLETTPVDPGQFPQP